MPADSGEGQRADDQRRLVGVVDRPNGAAVGVGLVLGAAEVDPGFAQGGEADDAAAGFGEEVSGEAEPVCPSTQPRIRVGGPVVVGRFGVKAALTFGDANGAGAVAGVGAAVRAVPGVAERAAVGGAGPVDGRPGTGCRAGGGAADAPAGGDEAGDVVAVGVVLVDGVVGDAGGGEPGGLRRLGGVLGEVAGLLGGDLFADHVVGDAAVPGEGKRLNEFLSNVKAG